MGDTTMTFTTFVLYDMVNALTCRSDVALVGTSRLPVFANKAFVVAIACCLVGQLLVVYTAFGQRVFGTEALSMHDVGVCAFWASLVLPLDILRKLTCSATGWAGSSPGARRPRRRRKMIL